MIKLHVLGAGGAVPTASHGPAAYWVEIDGQGLLLDPGPGALVRLVRQPGAVDTVDDVDTVLFSHLHLDHTADLAPLLFALHSILARNTVPLRLIGPVGLGAFLDGLRGLYGDWLDPRCRDLTVLELSAGEGFDLHGGGHAATHAAAHTENRFGAACLGWTFRDGDGRRLVYSGDTGPGGDLEHAAMDCDLLLVECSTPDDLTVASHLGPTGVANLARNTRPGRVVLTHMYPLVAGQHPDRTVTDLAGVPCAAARDGDVFAVPPETETST